MIKVRCNNCMEEFDEQKVIYDGETDTEYCPYCGECGCLMDLENEDKTLYDLASEMLEETPYNNDKYMELIKMYVSEYDDALNQIVFYIEKNWLQKYVKEKYNIKYLINWLQDEYTSEESEPILFDGIRAGVVAGVYKA